MSLYQMLFINYVSRLENRHRVPDWVNCVDGKRLKYLYEAKLINNGNLLLRQIIVSKSISVPKTETNKHGDISKPFYKNEFLSMVF